MLQMKEKVDKEPVPLSTLRMGLDVGSTTLKCAVVNGEGDILFEKYARHYARVTQAALDMLEDVRAAFPDEDTMAFTVSGSGGLGLSEKLNLPFEQEVYATRVAVERLCPGTDCVIELGGEDAKILFLTGLDEVRMNGACAGGTGAFIDQMASLLGVNPERLNDLSMGAEKTYTIASRCGVFAKSDIQPLLNQGARREDIAKSILLSVANQTVAGLAQGREIKGKVLYLGGPLTFLSGMRQAFDETLRLTGLCPEHSLYFVALGAALRAEKQVSLSGLMDSIRNMPAVSGYAHLPPLFKNQRELSDFRRRHNLNLPGNADLLPDRGAYIGIDAGSTTIKAAVLNTRGEVVFYAYQPNRGSPIPLVRDFLAETYRKFPGIRILGSAATGYGEELIKNAFRLDMGLVETVAHYTAAKAFDPKVDFIIDIGGQDIKCFKVRKGAIDSIFLNEACSSGCGSFLQTFAGALNMRVSEFSEAGLMADSPVDLGSRCTVFMNSQVKQAQRDGASLANISAGLSISVVKNALYKVIRVGDNPQSALGRHIVVQGGTFLNDAVLRAFEQEVGLKVTRPPMAGLMGAMGAALYARERWNKPSSILTEAELSDFIHEVKTVPCGGCANHCRLTVNTFGDGRKFIGGNQCDRPTSGGQPKETFNIYEVKRQLLSQFASHPGETRKYTIGIPLALNMYELLPFWHTFFTEMGFGVTISPFATRDTYLSGQNDIPSDTVCYPAKLVSGQVKWLVEQGVDAVFYPCMTYNIDEDLGDNHYNCPVVAYYPEVIGKNMKCLKQVQFIKIYISLERRAGLAMYMDRALRPYLGRLPMADMARACVIAYSAQTRYFRAVWDEGQKYLHIAAMRRLPMVVLAGRPYHIDPEVNHGIDRILCGMGAMVLSEDCLIPKYKKPPTNILNQWTYHSRLFGAAQYVARHPDNICLVQLVSFGCGVDAITTDEVRSILERQSQIYTQIKIDEITNPGAVRIRLRSLFSAMEARKELVP